MLTLLLIEEVAGLLVCVAFEVAVHRSALHSRVEIDLIAVEVGTVNASELCFSADDEAAAAAHSGSVDHYGVHGDNAGDIGGSYRLDDEFHHDEGTDGDDLIEGLAVCEHFVQGETYISLSAVGAVIGHDEETLGGVFELILEDKEILISEADYRGDLTAHIVESLSYRESYRAADTASDDADLLETLELGSGTEGTDEVPDIFALVFIIELKSGRADDLEDDPYGACGAVVAGDGEGDTLALLIDAEDNELTGLSLCGDERSLDIHHGDSGIEGLFADYFIHGL